MAAKRWLTAKEVSEQYGFAYSTLANWRAKGVGPAFMKRGNKLIRYSVADIESWLQSHRIRTSESPGVSSTR